MTLVPLLNPKFATHVAARRMRTSGSCHYTPRNSATRSPTIHPKHCIAIGSDRRLQRQPRLKVHMLDVSAEARRSARPPGGPPLDFQSHLALLEARGLLARIDRPINKDTELHPLVRWQFQGGLAEEQRRAFLFTNVVDG